jgi:hypothetical protein
VNAIVSFNSRADRDEVVKEISSAWPEVLAKSFIPHTRPDAIFEELSDDDYGRLENLVGSRGRVFQDQKFEPFEPR